ncbi:MAG TPA: 3-hydroxyacyl-CoA dehydrogenase [Burkholderiales bacterium]|nr:3-hydroxyacyl-CoA dehydrogenase [Burkholderiales bacterium]
MQLSNHTFLITGGGSGLGAATALLFTANGANVVLADIQSDVGEKLATKIGDHACFIKTDVTNEADVQHAVDTAISTFGALHGAVNCAGVVTGEKVLGKNGPHNYENFKRAVAVNLFGTFNVIRLAAETIAKNAPSESGERGVLINTSSVASFEGQIGQAAYSASKAGVNGMTLPIARELAKHGIRVVTIAPGLFDTPMMAGLPEDVRDSLGQQAPFPPRLGRPEEYAALAKHIVENEMLNGAIIRLDGAIRMAAK